MISVSAPAKINLTLEVLGKRADGYHEIRSVMQTISLCDRLSFDVGEKLEFRCDSAGWAAEKSLVPKAARLLQESTGCVRGATITVEKRIPLAGGLGGESSDAAGTLCGLNEHWQLGLPQEKLVEFARRLGSDVAFFLYGGTALAEGRGEVVTPLPPLPRMWMVLVVPEIPPLQDKTKQLYRGLNASHYTDGTVTMRLAAVIKSGEGFSADLLFNTFENIAFARFSGLGVYRRHIIKAGAPHVHLAGSGPTLFTMFEDKAWAEELCSRLEQQRMEAYLARTAMGCADM